LNSGVGGKDPGKPGAFDQVVDERQPLQASTRQPTLWSRRWRALRYWFLHGAPSRHLSLLPPSSDPNDGHRLVTRSPFP
jgi:hypothetical protein